MGDLWLSKRSWRRNCRENCPRFWWNQIKWLPISRCYNFSGRQHIKFYRFYWGWKIWCNHWLLFDEYCKLYEDKGKRISNFSIDNLQVRLIYTKYLFTSRTSFQISNINSRTRFFQVEGVWCRTKYEIKFLLFINFDIFIFNFHNVRFWAFISLILCAINVF